MKTRAEKEIVRGTTVASWYIGWMVWSRSTPYSGRVAAALFDGKEEQMNIELKTLAPLWTGRVDGRSDHVHETGIIGSLRWWYEAIVRGLEGWACEPTEHRCKDEERCAACELFGAIGWSRQFRLRVMGGQRYNRDGAKRSHSE